MVTSAMLDSYATRKMVNVSKPAIGASGNKRIKPSAIARIITITVPRATSTVVIAYNTDATLFVIKVSNLKSKRLTIKLFIVPRKENGLRNFHSPNSNLIESKTS